MRFRTLTSVVVLVVITLSAVACGSTKAESKPADSLPLLGVKDVVTNEAENNKLVRDELLGALAAKGIVLMAEAKEVINCQVDWARFGDGRPAALRVHCSLISNQVTLGASSEVNIGQLTRLAEHSKTASMFAHLATKAIRDSFREQLDSQREYARPKEDATR